MAILLILIAVGLLVVNAFTVMCFWYDKRRAIAGDRRVPESNLLALAMLGGTPGAYLARKLFRHKTRKQPFSTQLLLIAILQVGTGIGLFLV